MGSEKGGTHLWTSILRNFAVKGSREMMWLQGIVELREAYFKLGDSIVFLYANRNGQSVIH